jgi:hypothetical protein
MVLGALFLGVAIWGVINPGEWGIGAILATAPWSFFNGHPFPIAETWILVALNTVLWYLIGCGGSAALRKLRTWWQTPMSSK